MFLRLVTLFLLIGLAAGAASWLMAQPGSLAMEWLGWQIEMRSSLAVTLIAAFALAVVFFDRLQRAFRAMPRWLGGRWRQRRDDAGHRALTLGLMAVSAGEPTEARKQVARAHRLLDAPQLTGLLSAQVAHLAGDHAAARRYFSALVDDRDTAFLGQIGLMRLALDAKDTSAALDAANKALVVKPQSAVAAAQLWQLHAGQQQWAAALEAIAIVIKDRKKQSGNVPELLLRQRTALFYLDGMSMLQPGADFATESATDSAAAIPRFVAALRDDPAFLPAVLALADSYLAQTNRRKAIKLLEKSFTRVPHADIADRLQKLWDDNDGNSLARLIRLIPQKPLALQHAANHIVGDIAASSGLDGEAKRFRDLYDASIAAFGWQCSGCKSRHDSWHSHCPSCGHFAGLKWQQPEKVTPLLGD
jgi:HemY protein